MNDSIQQNLSDDDIEALRTFAEKRFQALCEEIHDEVERLANERTQDAQRFTMDVDTEPFFVSITDGEEKPKLVVAFDNYLTFTASSDE